MLSWLIKLFARQAPRREFTPEDYEKHNELKQQWLKNLLGSMHDMVGHSIVPYAVGGAVDMYYFPQSEGGTAFATMELIEPDGTGPRPSRIGTYELVAFTRHSWSSEPGDAFNTIERRFCGIFTTLGRYSTAATLNPNETCELPEDNEPNRCFIFDHISKVGVEFQTASVRHGLLLCVEVHRSELDFARQAGSAALIERLRSAGHYPYSDLAREVVA